MRCVSVNMCVGYVCLWVYNMCVGYVWSGMGSILPSKMVP